MPQCPCGNADLVWDTCLTAQTNRAAPYHSGRQGQSKGLCPRHRDIKPPGFSAQIMWVLSGQLNSSSPSGGCSIPPFFSQFPMGWISAESTSLQKSFLLSLPSRRRRRRAPVRPTTVAMHVDVVFRGSWASSFILILNSFAGGVYDCKEKNRDSRRARISTI